MGSFESLGIHPGAGLIRKISLSSASNSSPSPQVMYQPVKAPITSTSQYLPMLQPFLRAPQRQRTNESSIASRRSLGPTFHACILSSCTGATGGPSLLDSSAAKSWYEDPGRAER